MLGFFGGLGFMINAIYLDGRKCLHVHTKRKKSFSAEIEVVLGTSRYFAGAQYVRKVINNVTTVSR